MGKVRWIDPLVFQKLFLFINKSRSGFRVHPRPRFKRGRWSPGSGCPSDFGLSPHLPPLGGHPALSVNMTPLSPPCSPRHVCES